MTTKAVVGHISELPDAPTSDLPDGPIQTNLAEQDDARATALRIHTQSSLPFLEQLIKNKKKSDRLRMDAAKLIQQQALPPPQPVIGDIHVTIVVDM